MQSPIIMIKGFVFILCLLFATVVYGQRYSKDVKKMVQEIKKDDWKVLPGDDKLKNQINALLDYQNAQDTNGYPKYVVGHGIGVSGDLGRAQTQALDNAKMEIAKIVEAQVSLSITQNGSLAKISKEELKGLRNFIHKNSITFARKLNGTKTPLRLRQITEGDVEILMGVAHNSQQAREIYKNWLVSSGKISESQAEILIR